MNHTRPSFRHWVHEQWLKNRDELEAYNQQPRTLKDYWQQYRAWLRCQFRLEYPRDSV